MKTAPVPIYSILQYTASTATYKSTSKQLTATATGKMGKTVQKHEVDWLFMEKSIMMPSNTAGQDVGVLISLMFKSCHYSHFRSCPSSTASKSPNSMSGFSSLTCHNKNVRQIEGSTCQKLALWLNAHRISHHCRSELCFPTPGSCKMLQDVERLATLGMSAPRLPQSTRS